MVAVGILKIGCVEREETAAAVRAALACRPRCRAQVAKHRILATLQLLGNGPPVPPLLVDGPDLLMERQPPRLPLVCELLGRARRGWGWHGDGHRAVGLRHRRLAKRLCGDSLHDLGWIDEPLPDGSEESVKD
jgi:hypothetical protein